MNFLLKPFANYVTWHATSIQEKHEIINHFPLARVVVIPNGTYVEEFKKSTYLSKEKYLSKFLNMEKSNINKIIISMDVFIKKKVFDILINSFVEVARFYPNSYLLIAGPDGGEKSNLKDLIKHLGLTESVSHW